MTPATYGDQQVVRAGEVYRAAHVGDAGAAGNEIGVTVDHSVVDLAGGIVTIVAGTQQRAAQTGLEPGDRRLVRSFSVTGCHTATLQISTANYSGMPARRMPS